ncbi:MAG: right-handed parallel beta-helix repeat-containing protein [Acidobacteria bacterium]|nr:right-handed parallel beta-helix repeat-containing protein [Acidobacteriota bacterium]
MGNGVYYVRVVAANAFGQSPASNEVVTTVGLAKTVNCGDAIVVSTTLQSDLTCDRTGLIIGADGITLDLNGHSLTGPGGGGGYPGIIITGHTGVSIVNGIVNNFGHGVLLLSGANRNIIRNVTTNSQFFNGISVFGSSDNVIENCHVNGSGSFGVGLNGASNGNAVRNCTVTGSGSSGIFIGGGGGQPPSFNNVVTGNSVHDNPTTGPAISIFGSANNTVDGNDVVHNVVGTGGHGIGVSTGSNDNTVSNNHVSNNSALGISINNASLNNRVTANTVSGNTSNGVDLNSSTGNSVANNTVTGNSSNGIAVTAASGNSVTANQVTGNALSGLLIDSGSNTNQIFNNTVNGNNTTTGANSAGIFLTATTPAPRDNQIHDNTAVGNTRLDIEDRTTGPGTAGTLNTYASNNCVLGRPAALCVPPGTTPLNIAPRQLIQGTP